MRKTRIFVSSLGVQSDSLSRKESIINITITQGEAEPNEHCELTLGFLEKLNEFIERFNEQKLNTNSMIDAKDFFEWLKKEQFIKKQ